MKRVGIVTILSLAISVAAATAYAGDFCITYGISNTVFVIRGFKPPSAGKCKPFTKGAHIAGLSGIAVGSACTNTVGDNLRVAWSLTDPGGYSYNGRFDIPYPSLTGGSSQYTASYAPNTVDAVGETVTSAQPCATPVPIE